MQLLGVMNGKNDSKMQTMLNANSTKIIDKDISHYFYLNHVNANKFCPANEN